jgi:lycopene cyclase domain-containing protein
MGNYTIAAVCAPVLVVLLEVTVLRTGILRRGRLWLTIAIMLGFQILVDGWLTKLTAPVVHYQGQVISGLRWPWDIPVEDYGFGLAMILLSLVLWDKARRGAAGAGGG